MSCKEKGFAVLVIACLGVLVACFTSARTVLTFGTETDFVGGFIHEADRVLHGEPLLLKFHPPLYAFTLAAAKSLTGDWFSAGLAISFLSALAVAGSSFVFFRTLCGPYAGWGALLGLAASAEYVGLASLATSDMFFLALYSTSIALAALAYQQHRPGLWWMCGCLIGCTLLTRSNGITIACLVIAPWLGRLSFSEKRRCTMHVFAGLAAPLVIWLCFASATGSRYLPANNHVNLALTYFSGGPDRMSGDARRLVEGRFDGLIDVLTHDPVHIAKTYALDLHHLCQRVFIDLVEWPLGFLVLPGLFLLVLKSGKEFIWYLIAVTMFQVLLVNMKSYEARLYLFLLPLFGAALGVMYRQLHQASHDRWVRRLAASMLLACTLSAFSLAWAKTWRATHEQQAELEDAIPVAQETVDRDAAMLAAKVHLPYYVGCQHADFPVCNDLDQLKAHCDAHPMRDQLYLYYGSIESRKREPLGSLIDPDASPDWLERVASSKRPKGWALYRFKPTAPLVAAGR